MKLSTFITKLINSIVRYAMYIVQAVVWIRTALAPYEIRKCMPPINNELLFLSATQLAEAIRKRKVHCIDVINAYIHRIEEVNPLLNSVIQNRFEAARKEAELVDEILKTKPDEDFWKREKPLLGVPLTVKESVAVEGMSNNAAWSSVSSNYAKKDAEIIAQLRGAGMIPLAVTNLPELCLYWETFNEKHGTTNNPYDTRKTPGGSSGGEAALLGAGASVVGIGSDIGGSIRLPAMFCGVFGHKPTPGFISNQGHLPSSADPKWDSYFSICPMSRYAEDLPLILKSAISKKNKPELLKLDEKVDICKLKIFYAFGEGDSAIFADPISEDIRDAILKAAFKLETHYRCKTQEVKINGIEDSLPLTTLVLRLKRVESVYQVGDDPDVWKNVPNEIFKKLTLRSNASITAVSYAPLKLFCDSVPTNVIKAMELRQWKIKKIFNDLLGENAVLLYPTFPWSAPFHLRMAYQFLNSVYMILFTLIGLPVTQCPIGLNKEGMPVGIQIVAGRGQDRLCLAVAKALEKLCGGWKQPTCQNIEKGNRQDLQ